MGSFLAQKERRRSLLTVIPLVFSIAAFVLAMICLFAGSKKGQMEEYHIITVNMSDFGRDLATTSTPSPTATTTKGGIVGWITSEVGSAETAVSSAISSIEGDIADKISQELGISQWYSLHVMDACQGYYAPNATSLDAGYNTTNCTASRAGFQFNLTQTLDHELSLGPLKLNLDQLKFPSVIENAIHDLNSFLMAVFVFFALSSGFSGLSFLACIACLLVGTNSPINLGMAVLSGLAALCLMIASAITTGIANKGASEINSDGNEVGITASAGHKFITISWVAFALMAVSTIYWLAVMARQRRKAGGGRFPGFNRGEKRVSSETENVASVRR